MSRLQIRQNYAVLVSQIVRKISRVYEGTSLGMLAVHQRYDGVELLGLFEFKKICRKVVQVNGLAHYTDPTIQH
jgi:hypothetical protein